VSGQICLFESDEFRRLLPLAYFRPVYELRLGIFTLRERIERHYRGATIVPHCRRYLEDLLTEQGGNAGLSVLADDTCLFLNGAVVANRELADRVPLAGPENVAYVARGQIVAARLSGARVSRLKKNHTGNPRGTAKAAAGKARRSGARQKPSPETTVLTAADFAGLTRQEIDAELIRFPWVLVHRNAADIEEDFASLPAAGRLLGRVRDGAHLVAPDRIHIGEGSVVWPGAALDAESGPIYIGRDVTISPGAVVRGPVFIGDGCVINPQALILRGVSVGPLCRLGGEVSTSIIQGYSNKQHLGFLGHSYVGEWVNLGAGTSNSNLKNNYGTVRVVVDGESVDTGEAFVGLMVGDHSKSGINSMFNTGTVVGACCNIYGSGFPPKYIPSFLWGGADGFVEHEPDRCVESARRVMDRRHVALTPAYERVMRTVHALSQAERKRFLR